jgi:hypothetical protein
MKAKAKKARATPASGNDSNHRARSLIDAAADAAMELSAAAESFRESWRHVQNAQKRGKTAAKPLLRTGKKIMKAAKRTTRRTAKKISRKRSS